MKNILYTIILSFLFSSSVFADFEAGDDAYEAGDYATAIKEFKVAAEQGHVDAQYNLGVMYQFGYGVSQNHEEAVRWYELAAYQGNSSAKRQLGVVFVLLGTKLRKNNIICQNMSACKKALEFYYKAAELGNGDAMLFIPSVLLILDIKTTSKIDKLKSKQKNVMWWILGIEVGNASPELIKNTKVILNEMKKELTLFEAGERLARECIKKNYKDCG